MRDRTREEQGAPWLALRRARGPTEDKLVGVKKYAPWWTRTCDISLAGESSLRDAGDLAELGGLALGAAGLAETSIRLH